ncbi:XkdQ/YqbQ family protein [Metabacillus fastidiosus]|uniref:XkdQ/YqbQ family protein n=1 Tax=Metabacillus fastidiosus TaxID=1458 RepID=UPI003D2A0945
MMKLFLLQSDEMIEIPTESITWSGTRYKAARKIEATIMRKMDYHHKVISIDEGHTVLFRWKGTELFRGVVFNRSQTKNGLMSIVAYDTLQYLLLNKDVYIFKNQRADQIALRIFKDFEIAYQNISNTGYVIKNLPFTSETMLYDIIMKALISTEKQTKKRFYLRSEKGKITLQQIASKEAVWALETGVNLLDYSYTTSIEETATRVKLVSGEEKKQLTAIVTDEVGKQKYGVLQYFENVSEKLNQAQLTERAKQIQAKKKGIKKTLSIEALGITDLISNNPVKVIEKDLGINQTYFIDSDTHKFKGNSHTMSLNLIEHNDLPEGDAA